MLTKIKNNLSYIIIAILVIVILFLRSCNSSKPIDTKPIVTIKVDTVYKTIEKTIPVYVPGPIKIITEKVIIGPTKLDTITILKDYFNKKYYVDKIKIDSFGYITINDTISMNKILSRKIIESLKIPVITKTVTIQQPYIPKNQLYVGGSLSGIKQIGIGPNVIFKTKQDHLYIIGASINSTGLNYSLGMTWKIHIK